jgi:hypothetical protein
MVRWLLLLALLWGMGTGISRGWIELRWGRMLQDLGLPFVADPGSPEDCPPVSDI